MMRAGETGGFVDNSNAARATRQGSCKITRTCIPPGDQCVCAVRTCGGGDLGRKEISTHSAKCTNFETKKKGKESTVVTS